MSTLLANFDADMDLPWGTHLVVHHFGYQHHGIYVGEGRVVHYSGFSTFLSHGPVQECSISSFTTGHKVSLKLTSQDALSPDQVVARARSRLGEDEYSLLTNNCEHFCEWCVHGVSRSAQVEVIASPLRSFLRPLKAFLHAMWPQLSMHCAYGVANPHHQ
ncbi:lecithin retinol acyltransferase family protein [Cupriavidus basilensis]